MTNARYSNGSLFVQFADGDFSLTTCGKDFALQVIAMIEEGSSKEELLIVLNPEFEKLQQEVDQIKKENEQVELIVDSVLNDDRFYLSEGKLYRQGIPLSIPKVLAEKISECITNNDQDQLNRLDKFWARCVRIRNAQAREQFYDYIKANELLITEQGAVLGFRRANIVGNKPNLVKFITQEYFRLRKNKKSTNINVFEDDGEYNTKGGGNSVGVLKDIYNNLSNSETHFESWHKSQYHNKPEKFWIGKETRLPIEECDTDPNVSCGAGLHGAGKRFSVDGFGDTPIVFAFDPSKLLACPDNYDTFRTQSQVFLSVLDNDREFEVTPKIQKAIDEIVGRFDLELDNIDLKELKDHTLLQEVPDVDIRNLFTAIKETVNPSIVKERYTKL